MTDRKLNQGEFPKGIEPHRLPHSELPKDPFTKNYVSYNSSKTKFVFIYSVSEVSMCNYIGQLVYGDIENGEHKLRVLPEHYRCRVACNGLLEQFLYWFNDDILLFNLPLYDSSQANGYDPAHAYHPTCGVNFNKGLFVVPQSNVLPKSLNQFELEDVSIVHPNQQSYQGWLEYFKDMKAQGRLQDFVNHDREKS